MDEKKFEDLVYSALTKFYQKVIAPKMATKEDLAEVRGEMAKDLAEVRGEMATKADINRLEVRMDNVESKVSSLEKAVWSVSDHQGKVLEEHGKRITALEEA